MKFAAGILAVILLQSAGYDHYPDLDPLTAAPQI